MLRIIAMFSIAVHHILIHGGVLNHCNDNSIQYRFSWLINTLVFCAVDIFALISGYVLCQKHVTIMHFLKLWARVAFYSLLCTIIADIFLDVTVGTKGYINALAPLTHCTYWYFTAYTGLLVLAPLMNIAIHHCKISFLKKLFVVILFMFSILGSYYKIFNLNNGYSFVWVTLLYILGAIIKKCEIGKNLKGYIMIGCIVILYLISYIHKLFGTHNRDLLVLYTSPTLLIISILFLIMFSRMKIKPNLKRFIIFASPSVFSVYLIHDHPYIQQNLIKNSFQFLSKENIVTMFMIVTSTAVIITIGGIFIDKIRIALFKKLKIEEGLLKVSEIGNNILGKMIQHL